MKLLIASICTLGLSMTADAHIGDQVYPVFELSDQDLARIDLRDSSVWDWQTILGPPTFVPRDLHTSDLGKAHDASEFDYSIWLAWHNSTNRIYVAVERLDDLYFNQYDRENLRSLNSYMYFQDSTIHFMVDGDHSGGEVLLDRSELDDEKLLEFNNRQAQWYLGIAEVFDEGPHVSLMEDGFRYFTDWFVKAPFSESGGGVSSDDSHTTITEFYITPFDQLEVTSQAQSVPASLYADKIIGLALFIMDYDADNAALSSLHHLPRHSWGHGLPAHEFVDGVLISHSGGTAVEDLSWARIKSSIGH